MGSYWHTYCERWSVLASSLVYLSFLGLVWTLALPLRSPKLTIGLHRGPTIILPVVDELPDHLEGVRIERDGDINTNFRKEVLFGEGEFERRKEEDPKELLEDIFIR